MIEWLEWFFSSSEFGTLLCALLVTLVVARFTRERERS